MNRTKPLDEDGNIEENLLDDHLGEFIWRRTLWGSMGGRRNLNQRIKITKAKYHRWPNVDLTWVLGDVERTPETQAFIFEALSGTLINQIVDYQGPRSTGSTSITDCDEKPAGIQFREIRGELPKHVIWAKVAQRASTILNDSFYLCKK
ncbi:hypothetical protein RF11_10694 [Thelohanellus kitauei]|uniref:Uncharacterized protein n=1 Tax=Thelohanellus kitauei TaxID=669202 RepID=A0A0C2MDE3_THEKT|nr:hypothetical protein RF11_10694 [Thelohanellus kitauei]